MRLLLVVVACLGAGCTLDFDASRIPRDDAAARGGASGGAGGASGGAGAPGGGAGGAAGMNGPMVLWLFDGTGQPASIPDRGTAGLRADLYPVLSSDFGRGTLKDGAWESDRAALRTDPGPGTAAVSALDRAGAISLEAWAFVRGDIEGKGSIVSAGLGRLLQTAIGTEFDVATTSSDESGYPVTLLPPSRMRHIVGTWANGNTVSRLYLDGDEADSHDLATAKTPAPVLAPPDGESRLQVGDAAWVGRIWLVALYDRALTAADVRALFAAGPLRGR